MQFSNSVESYTTDNQTWLGSRHGTDVARTVTIDGTAAADFDEYIPSGIPLKLDSVTGKYAPVDDVADVLAGFLLTAQAFDGASDVVAPLLDRGRVRATRLPAEAFDVTTLTTPNPLFVIQED